MADGGNRSGVPHVLGENVRLLLPPPQLHILHGVERDKPFGEYSEAERVLQYRRESEHIAPAHGRRGRAIGIGTAVAHEVNEGLQMVGGDGFQLPLAQGVPLDTAHRPLISHHCAIAQCTRLQFFLHPHIQHIAHGDVFRFRHKPLFLVVLHRPAEQGFRFGLALGAGVLLLHPVPALVLNIEAIVPLFTFFAYRTFCH